MRRCRGLHRPILSSVLALCVGWLSAAHAQPAAPSIEGRWLGTVGNHQEQVEVGLEFRRHADGRLEMLLTQPVSNYYGLSTGSVEQDGDRIVHRGLGLDLVFDGDSLAGRHPSVDGRVVFQRVDALPSKTPVPDVPPGPGPAWQQRLGGSVYASPVVSDGIAYIGTTGGVMNAVDTRNGKLAWAFATGTPLFGSAAIDGDALYVLGDDGTLFRLRRGDGTLAWKTTLQQEPVGRVLPHPSVFDWDWQAPQPLVDNGVVYVGTGDGNFHAVAAGTGESLWTFGTEGRIRNGAAVSADRVYFGSADHFVYAVDAGTGSEIWRADTGAKIDATPVVHGTRVLVGTRGAGLWALHADTGERLWRNAFWDSWVESTPVVHGDTIYIGSSDLRRVSAIDLEDGRVRWRSDVRGWTWGTPLVDGDRLHVGVAGGTPYFIEHVAGYVTLDRNDGEMLTRWPIADTGGHQWGIAGSPAMGDGVVVVATIAGSLYGFPLR